MCCVAGLAFGDNTWYSTQISLPAAPCLPYDCLRGLCWCGRRHSYGGARSTRLANKKGKVEIRVASKYHRLKIDIF